MECGYPALSTNPSSPAPSATVTGTEGFFILSSGKTILDHSASIQVRLERAALPCLPSLSLLLSNSSEFWCFRFCVTSGVSQPSLSLMFSHLPYWMLGVTVYDGAYSPEYTVHSRELFSPFVIAVPRSVLTHPLFLYDLSPISWAPSFPWNVTPNK